MFTFSQDPNSPYRVQLPNGLHARVVMPMPTDARVTMPTNAEHARQHHQALTPMPTPMLVVPQMQPQMQMQVPQMQPQPQSAAMHHMLVCSLCEYPSTSMSEHCAHYCAPSVPQAAAHSLAVGRGAGASQADPVPSAVSTFVPATGYATRFPSHALVPVFTFPAGSPMPTHSHALVRGDMSLREAQATEDVDMQAEEPRARSPAKTNSPKTKATFRGNIVDKGQRSSRKQSKNKAPNLEKADQGENDTQLTLEAPLGAAASKVDQSPHIRRSRAAQARATTASSRRPTSASSPRPTSASFDEPESASSTSFASASTVAPSVSPSNQRARRTPQKRRASLEIYDAPKRKLRRTSIPVRSPGDRTASPQTVTVDCDDDCRASPQPTDKPRRAAKKSMQLDSAREQSHASPRQESMPRKSMQLDLSGEKKASPQVVHRPKRRLRRRPLKISSPEDRNAASHLAIKRKCAARKPSMSAGHGDGRVTSQCTPPSPMLTGPVEGRCTPTRLPPKPPVLVAAGLVEGRNKPKRTSPKPVLAVAGLVEGHRQFPSRPMPGLAEGHRPSSLRPMPGLVEGHRSSSSRPVVRTEVKREPSMTIDVASPDGFVWKNNKSVEPSQASTMSNAKFVATADAGISTTRIAAREASGGDSNNSYSGGDNDNSRSNRSERSGGSSSYSGSSSSSSNYSGSSDSSYSSSSGSSSSSCGSSSSGSRTKNPRSPTTFKCFVCGRTFPTERKQVEHVSTAHTVPPPLERDDEDDAKSGSSTAAAPRAAAGGDLDSLVVRLPQSLEAGHTPTRTQAKPDPKRTAIAWQLNTKSVATPPGTTRAKRNVKSAATSPGAKKAKKNAKSAATSPGAKKAKKNAKSAATSPGAKRAKKSVRTHIDLSMPSSTDLEKLVTQSSRETKQTKASKAPDRMDSRVNWHTRPVPVAKRIATPGDFGKHVGGSPSPPPPPPPVSSSSSIRFQRVITSSRITKPLTGSPAPPPPGALASGSLAPLETVQRESSWTIAMEEAFKRRTKEEHRMSVLGIKETRQPRKRHRPRKSGSLKKFSVAEWQAKKFENFFKTRPLSAIASSRPRPGAAGGSDRVAPGQPGLSRPPAGTGIALAAFEKRFALSRTRPSLAQHLRRLRQAPPTPGASSTLLAPGGSSPPRAPGASRSLLAPGGSRPPLVPGGSSPAPPPPPPPPPLLPHSETPKREFVVGTVVNKLAASEANHSDEATAVASHSSFVKLDASEANHSDEATAAAVASRSNFVKLDASEANHSDEATAAASRSSFVTAMSGTGGTNHDEHGKDLQIRMLEEKLKLAQRTIEQLSKK